MNKVTKTMLIALPLFVMAGCTTYDIKACHTGVCTEVHTSSMRQFEKPVVMYERKEADGSGVTFNFGAESATGSYLEQAAAQTLIQLPSVIAGIALPVAPRPPAGSQGSYPPGSGNYENKPNPHPNP
jgi:hypothetical protein